MPALYQDDPTDRCEICEAELGGGERDQCSVCLLELLRAMLADPRWCSVQGQRRHTLTGVLEIDRVRAEVDALEERLGDDRTEEQQARDAEMEVERHAHE